MVSLFPTPYQLPQLRKMEIIEIPDEPPAAKPQELPGQPKPVPYHYEDSTVQQYRSDDYVIRSVRYPYAWR